MVSNIQIFYIIGGSVSCFLLVVCLIRHHNQINRENNDKGRQINFRRKLMVSHKVKPIFQMTDEELKDEFEQYEMRTPQITGEEKV